MLVGAVDPEVVRGRARRHHQVIERHRTLAGEAHLVAIPVDREDLVLAEAHPLVGPEQAPHGISDIGRVQPRGGHLVQQGLEGVEVVAVDEGDVDRLALQAFRRRQAAEAGPDDHDLGLVWHGSMVA